MSKSTYSTEHKHSQKDIHISHKTRNFQTSKKIQAMTEMIWTCLSKSTYSAKQMYTLKPLHLSKKDILISHKTQVLLLHIRVIQKKLFFLVDKKRLNHRCQYIWRAQISIFRVLSQKMAVFRHFLVLEGNIAEGISKNRIWAITFDWSVLRT